MKVDSNTARSEWGECVYECGSTIHLPYIRCIKLALYQVHKTCPISGTLNLPFIGCIKLALYRVH